MLVSDIVARSLPDWVRENELLYNSCIAGAISEEAYIEGLRVAGLEEVEVRQRIIYDAAQLLALVQSELPDNAREGICRTASTRGVTVEELARSQACEIWSAMFHARKGMN